MKAFFGYIIIAIYSAQKTMSVVITTQFARYIKETIRKVAIQLISRIPSCEKRVWKAVGDVVER